MNVAKFALILSVAACTACVSDAERSRYSGPRPVPHYDVPAQVIYRIDDHRYISFENYSDCFHGDSFYVDTRQGIRTALGREALENFQGKVINADPTGQNLVFPMAAPPHTACSDRSCSTPLAYSTDSGRTFHGMVYMKTFDPFTRSKRHTMAVTNDALYVVEQMDYDALIRRYPLISGINLLQPYPEGLHDQSAWASKSKLLPTGLSSPSGQERFTCDASIRPSNPPISQ